MLLVTNEVGMGLVPDNALGRVFRDATVWVNGWLVRRHEGGYVVQGPGFYIWDEDPREVVRAARELLRGGRRVTPTTRLLILRDDFENTAS